MNLAGWLIWWQPPFRCRFQDRQELLLKTDPIERLKALNNLLAQELDVLQLEDKIQTQVQSEVDKNQREFYLREQMKAIQN